MRLDVNDKDMIKYMLIQGVSPNEIRRELRISIQKYVAFMTDDEGLGAAKDRLRKMFNSFVRDEIKYNIVLKINENSNVKNYDYEDMEDLKIPAFMKLRHVSS